MGLGLGLPQNLSLTLSLALTEEGVEGGLVNLGVCEVHHA